MGRKVNEDRVWDVVETVKAHDGQYRANDIAEELGLHPQTVSRLLSATETVGDERLVEDDYGFLGIFKK